MTIIISLFFPDLVFSRFYGRLDTAVIRVRISSRHGSGRSMGYYICSTRAPTIQSFVQLMYFSLKIYPKIHYYSTRRRRNSIQGLSQALVQKRDTYLDLEIL